MTNKSKSKKELDVDFIGGEELTSKEELELKEFFAKVKAIKQRNLMSMIKKPKERVK